MSVPNKGPSSSVAPQDNLSYLNSNAQAQVLRVTAQRDPTVNDRRFKIGTIWINQITNDVFVLTSVTLNQANWQPTSLSSGSFPVTPYVVGPVGEAGYQTIQSALDAANAAGGGIVAVQPGGSPYTENLTLYPNTQVVGVIGLGDGGSIRIIGVHTPPSTGTFIFRNLQLESATHIYSSTAAGTANLLIIDAQLIITNGYAFNLPNWTAPGNLEMFDVNAASSTNDGGINNTGGAEVRMFTCGVGLGTNNMILSGNATFFGCGIGAPIVAQTGANIDIDGSVVTQTITLNNDAALGLRHSSVFVGANSALVHNSTGEVFLDNDFILSTAATVIDGTGAGTLNIGNITFPLNNLIAATLTIGNNIVKSGYINSLSDVVLSSPGGHIEIEGGAVTDFIGSATLVGGTVTVANTNITATDRILVVRSTTGGTEGHLSYTITPSTSFTINSSSGTDTSTVVYVIIRQI